MKQAVAQGRAGCLLACALLFGCASMPKEVQRARATSRESSRAELPAGTPAVYREVLEFLWEVADASYTPEGKNCAADFGLWSHHCSFPLIEKDPKVRARWDDLTKRLLELPYTGRFEDDLLLERVRALHLDALDDDVPAHTKAKKLRLERFSFFDAPLAVRKRHHASYMKPPERTAHDEKITLVFPRSCAADIAALRRATAPLGAHPDFVSFARALLDLETLTRFPSLHPSLPPGANERSCDFIEVLAYAELARIARAELARPSAEAREPLAPTLVAVDAAFAREGDPLLRDVYKWLVTLAAANPLFKPKWLEGPTGTPLPFFELLSVLEKHGSAFTATLPRERTKAQWAALARLALERPWTGQVDLDVPLLWSLRLLESARPEDPGPEQLTQLKAHLKKTSLTFRHDSTVTRLIATRLAASPGASLAALLFLDEVVKGQRPVAWKSATVLEAALTERSMTNLDALAASRGGAQPGTATQAVTSWLLATLSPRVNLDGPQKELAATCLARNGLRVISGGPEQPTVRVIASEPVARQEKKTAGSVVTETYFLSSEEKIAIERALKNELAEIERVEDYAAYVRGRATRMKLTDEKLRHGRETARDRNFDAGHAQVNEATQDARAWAEAERERIQEELARLDEPRERRRKITTSTTETTYDAKVSLRLDWLGRSETISLSTSHPTAAEATAAAPGLVCAAASKVQAVISTQAVTLLSATGPATSELDRLAEAFIMGRKRAQLGLFLDALPIAAR